MEQPVTSGAPRTGQSNPVPSSTTHAKHHPNQFALLTQRRFAPFFWT